jgi:hypothetical protein
VLPLLCPKGFYAYRAVAKGPVRPVIRVGPVRNKKNPRNRRAAATKYLLDHNAPCGVNGLLVKNSGQRKRRLLFRVSVVLTLLGPFGVVYGSADGGCDGRSDNSGDNGSDNGCWFIWNVMKLLEVARETAVG